MPEMAEASRLFSAFDFLGALRHLERCVQVMESVRIPAMQLVAHGALAQALRAAGLASREKQVWDRLRKLDCTAELRLPVLSGATCSALHRGDADEALARCDEATRLCTVPESFTIFNIHRSVAIALGTTPAAAVNTLEQAVQFSEPA